MKKRNFLMMAAVMLAMTLTACGGKPADESKPVESQPEQSQPVESQPEESKPVESQPVESSKPVESQPASSQPVESQPASSQPAESSEPAAPVKAVTVSSVNLVAKESKVYLQLEGTAAEYTAAEFVWALALQHAGSASSGDASEEFILGTTAEFVDADYTLPATLNPDGSFLFEYSLSDIAAIGPGLFTIHARAKGLAANVAVGTVNNGATVKDGANRYYIRADVNSRNTIAVDALPPVEITEVSIVTDTETGKIYAKIGGEASASITQEVLDGYDTFIQFQLIGVWTNTRLTKVGGDGDYHFHWKKEGTKAFLYADVSFFEGSADWEDQSGNAQHRDSSSYNTHLNMTTASQADCKLEIAIDQNFQVKNGAGKDININVVSKPGATAQDDIWGNLGFIVTDIVSE